MFFIFVYVLHILYVFMFYKNLPDSNVFINWTWWFHEVESISDKTILQDDSYFPDFIPNKFWDNNLSLKGQYRHDQQGMESES